MHIEQINLKNFRSFKKAEMRDIPRFAILIGANGTGKSTFFSIFGFLRDAMLTNVTTALAKLGGSRGFQEVRSRDSNEPIEIEIKFRAPPQKHLITYTLSINEKDGRAIVEHEVLKYRRGGHGKPWHFLDFKNGKGTAVTNEIDEKVSEEKDLKREEQELKSPDILAIKGLAQFEKFPAVKALGTLIENWHVSDFHINKARPEQEAGYAEYLSREGENLSNVVEYLYKQHRNVFDSIIEKLSKRVPGIASVETKQTEEGRILLKFRDGAFTDPFLARNVSDGTIKMLAYLVLLYDPNPHPLLCVEEPENQLYSTLLEELAEEFREYSRRGGQVFVSTHSPDFLNAAQLEEVFWLQKKDGYTTIKCARDDKQIEAYMKEGDKMGWLWKQGFLGEVNP
ncbi:MAG: AAA family ATPase [Puniceicoccales bacterium]|jgi:predicted ATPase|nr:AAA family ATPase [Puniceicoccales bacterium]